MSFFVLEQFPDESQTGFRTDFLQTEDVNRGPAPRCPTCGGYTGMLAWLPPFRVELETWGNTVGDLALGNGADILVSERFHALYHE